MNVWLNASERFSLKMNGEFFKCEENCIYIENLAPSFVEVLPHSDKKTTAFYLDYPPKSHKNCVFTLLENDLFIDVTFEINMRGDFKILHQNRFEDVLVTVYKDGVTRIVCENKNYVETVNVPCGFESFSSFKDKDSVIIHSNGSPCFLAIFSIKDGLIPLFCNVVNDFTLSPVFHTKTRLFNLERSTVTCEWTGEKTLSPKITNVSHASPYLPNKGKLFLERCFFERVYFKLPLDDLLAPSIKENAQRLGEYLGNFYTILPSFCSKKGACLVYENNGKRTVKIYTIDIENNLICNVKEV